MLDTFRFLAPLLATLESQPDIGVVTPLVAKRTDDRSRVWARHHLRQGRELFLNPLESVYNLAGVGDHRSPPWVWDPCVESQVTHNVSWLADSTLSTQPARLVRTVFGHTP